MFIDTMIDRDVSPADTYVACPDCGGPVKLRFILPTNDMKLVACGLCPSCSARGDRRSLHAVICEDDIPAWLALMRDPHTPCFGSKDDE